MKMKTIGNIFVEENELFQAGHIQDHVFSFNWSSVSSMHNVQMESVGVDWAKAAKAVMYEG